MWDRSKQKHFVLRRGNPWSVCDMKGVYVCDFPAFSYDMDLVTKICFAENDEDVKKLLGLSVEEKEV